MDGIDGVLLDMDGVLAVSWVPIEGAAATVRWLRERELPFRLITNTTTQTCRRMAGTLTDAGIPVEPSEIISAVVGTAAYLRSHHAGSPCFLLSDGDPREDLEGVELVDVEQADVIVIGGACEDFGYPTMNAIFRRLMDGAALVGMHRNMYWRISEGLELDAGAYIAGLEEAAGVDAVICGKPAPAFFEAALSVLGIAAGRTAMVGDDIANDVLAAQSMGLTGVLVRTGKFRESDLERGRPDHVLASVADLPELFGSG